MKGGHYMRIIKVLILVLLFNFPSYADVATFAGGCFWCMEPPFEKLDGVSKVVSGYMGGGKGDATYKKVSSGETSHLEVVQVTFDPIKVSYKKLLDTFWRNVDPTQTDGQFVDRGPQYHTRIFYHSKEQKELAEKSKKGLEESRRFSKSIYTPIMPAMEFYPAEDYHQDYYKKSSFRYKLYRVNSGRDQFIEKYWGPKGKNQE